MTGGLSGSCGSCGGVDRLLIGRPARSLASPLLCLATSSSGSVSASMTRMMPLLRSWLRSSRTVSMLASTSSLAPAMKPAMKIALKRRHVQLGLDRCFDRDLGIAGTRRERGHKRQAKAADRLSEHAVIDFLEQVVVLPDERIVGLERERLLVRGSGLRQLTLVLVGHREVVERCGVGGIELGGAFPAVDRLMPEPALRHLDAEFDLFLGIASLVGPQAGSRHQAKSRPITNWRANMGSYRHYSHWPLEGQETYVQIVQPVPEPAIA